MSIVPTISCSPRPSISGLRTWCGRPRLRRASVCRCGLRPFPWCLACTSSYGWPFRGGILHVAKAGRSGNAGGERSHRRLGELAAGLDDHATHHERWDVAGTRQQTPRRCHIARCRNSRRTYRRRLAAPGHREHGPPATILTLTRHQKNGRHTAPVFLSHLRANYLRRATAAPRPAASRRISALSVFSHENAVNVLPFLSVTS